MKQHITPKQAKEITEEQFYALFDTIVKREDWANFHHKKVTIGLMIEFLYNNGWNIKIENIKDCFYVEDNKSTKIVVFELELCDALWEAVKRFIKGENV